MVLKKRNKNFMTMIYLFFIFTFFVSLFLNLNEIKGKVIEENIIQLELAEKLSKDQISDLEKKLLKMGNVKKIKYSSKERALNNLVRDLQISIPESSNPLPNSFVVILEEKGDYKELIQNLEEDNRITQFHLNEENIEKNILQLKEMDKILKFLSFIFLIPNIFTIFMSYRGMCHDNYIYFYFVSKNREKIDIKAKKAVFLPILSAGIIGTFSFLNLYFFLKNSNIQYIENLFKLSTEYLAIVNIMMNLGLIIILFLVPFNVKKPEKEGIE
ncbi:MAG: cell division protein FtsX [Fusobacteriaceae bacterium]